MASKQKNLHRKPSMTALIGKQIGFLKKSINKVKSTEGKAIVKRTLRSLEADLWAYRYE